MQFLQSILNDVYSVQYNNVSEFDSFMSEVLKSESSKAPKSLKSRSLSHPEPAFGWTAYAEQINGRFAMLGFMALLLLELVTKQDLLTWLGLR